MNSAKSILHSIVLATQHVRNTIARYSTVKGVRQVRQHSLVRLELEFQTITDASRAILEVFDDPSLRRHYMLDDRLMDWLSGPEPEMCLNTLGEMEKLLNIDHEVQVFSGFATSRTGYQDDDINAAITRFDAHKAHFHFLLTTDIWNYEKEAPRKTMQSKTEEKRVQSQGPPQPMPTKDGSTEHQRKEILSQKLNKFLKFLDALGCSEKHRETSSIRQSDTCMWLPATDAYRSWREGKDTFLWLQGKAGAGKSVLASSVIDDLNATRKDEELLVYFYCDFRTGKSTSSVEVMRSLLAQLTELLCDIMMDPETLLDGLLKGADSRVDPFYSAKGLARYLSKVAGLCPRKPLVVVDALDECREVEALLDSLILCSGDVRMFVTSRPLQNIIQMLSQLPCISMDEMANELSADILLHVTRELDSRSQLRTFDGGLKEEIRSQLCAKADGMFRWVQCQIDTLEKCTSVSEIRRVLESLPEGLEETYRRILIAIGRYLDPLDANLVRHAFVWLVAALRPIRLRELLEGLAIDPIRRVLDSRFTLIKGADFLEVSRSLVIHHKETDIVTLSHMSVKEYLLGELVHPKLQTYHIVLEDAHEQLARLSMAYISFCLEQMEEFKDRSSNATREQEPVLTTSYASRPLLKYVLSDGFRHLGHLGSSNTGIFKDMETLQVVICRQAWGWDRMCKLVPSIRSGIPWPSSEHDFTMYTLVAFASDDLFRAFLDRPALTPREGTNPLVYAAHFGKTDHARALILRGANVNHLGLVVDKLVADGLDMDDTDADGSDADDSESDASIADCSDEGKAIPIQVAVDHWHTEMLDLLLAQGSTIPDGLLTRVLRVQPHRFPLYIIRRLLQTAEFVKWATTPWDNRRLLEAVVEDEEDYAQMDGGDELILATRGLVQAGFTETLLLVAVEKGCIPVVRILLSTNTSLPMDIPSASQPHAIVNALAANGDTPLHVAMRLSDEHQCLIITKLLVEAGCSPCGLDADDKPPIHVAVARGFVSVVEYLLSRDVPLPSRILFAALQAIVVKRAEMIRLLVSKGANVHVLNPDGDALLHITMRSLDRSVCLEIAETLIDVGCNPLARNLRGETPLHIAAKQGYHNIVNYLMLPGSSSDISSLLRDDPAAQLPMFCSLISNTNGIRISPEDEAGVMQVLQQFLDGPDKCLEWAMVFVHAAGDPFVCSSGSAMLFDIAVKQNYGEVVEYLTSQSVPLPSAILFTALRHQPSMIPSLIDRGADVHALNKDGDTLLHVAMSILGETQCRATTQILVEAGCDPFMLNTANKQPIHIAISQQTESIVEYLVSHTLNAKVSLPPDLLFTALGCHAKPSMIRSLADHGADLSYIAPNGDHVLHSVFKMLAGEYDPQSKITEVFTILNDLLSRDVPLPSDILFLALDSFPRSLPKESAEKQTSIISLLVLKGANVHARDPHQNTLLHRVMRLSPESRCVQVAKLLIKAGCSTSIRNVDGKLPIEIAVTLAMPTVVEYLLSCNAALPPDILLALLIDRGPSSIAVQNVALALETKLWRIDVGHRLDVVDVLVRTGCNMHVRDAEGRTPLELAVSRGYREVAEYLRRLPPSPLPLSRRHLPPLSSVRRAISNSKFFSPSRSSAR